MVYKHKTIVTTGLIEMNIGESLPNPQLIPKAHDMEVNTFLSKKEVGTVAGVRTTSQIIQAGIEFNRLTITTAITYQEAQFDDDGNEIIP